MRAVAAKRMSGWLSNICAAIAFAAGSVGFAIAVLSYRASALLPDVGSSSEQKFTESANVLFGGIIIGAIFQFIALTSLGIALLHSTRRRRTMFAGAPLLAFLLFFLWLSFTPIPQSPLTQATTQPPPSAAAMTLPHAASPGL